MLKRSWLLPALACASLLTLAIARPLEESAQPAVDDPFVCPYCGGGATLEIITGAVNLRALALSANALTGR